MQARPKNPQYSRPSFPLAAIGCSVLWLCAALSSGCSCNRKPEAAPEPAVQAPEPITSSLQSVWGTSKDNVWAVGVQGTIVHFDGKRWLPIESGTKQKLASISGTAADDIWAVGDGGLVLHFDGHTWQEKTAGRENSTMLSVVAASRDEVWVGGVEDGVGALRYFHDGKTWETHNISAASSLWRTWISSTNSVWMVGTDEQSKQGFVLRGHDKTFDRVPFEGTALRGIVGSSDNDVWVSAYDGTLHHWDGSAWKQTMSVPDAHWLGMLSFGAKDNWVFGFDGAVFHYDGAQWSRVPSGTTAILWSAWGSAPNDVWFVGNDGTRAHWDGKTLAPI